MLSHNFKNIDRENFHQHYDQFNEFWTYGRITIEFESFPCHQNRYQNCQKARKNENKNKKMKLTNFYIKRFFIKKITQFMFMSHE